MSYNKIKYWNGRVDPNNSYSRSITGTQINWMVEQINVEDKTMLDYGPGVGRLIGFYRNFENVNFYDISSKYKNQLIQLCEENDIIIDNYIIDKTGKIKTEFDDNQFDVLVCSEVLLHVPEDEIIDVMNELARISNKVIVNTWFDSGETIQNSHCFTRDYKRIIENNNLELLEWNPRAIDKQLGFVYKQK